MELKTMPFELKSADNGEVTAYFSTFDIKADSYGDIVAPHAFDATIKARKETGKPFPLVWNHNMDDPELIIGQVDDIKCDEHGALMTAHFYDTPKAQAVRNLLKEGSVYQLSFAYEVKAWREPTKEEKAIDPNIRNVLEEVELLEITITPTPANPRAEVVSAKAADDTEVKSGRRNSAKDLDTMAEIEGHLKEAMSGLAKLKETVDDTDEGKDEAKANEASEEQKQSNLESRKTAIEAFIKSMED